MEDVAAAKAQLRRTLRQARRDLGPHARAAASARCCAALDGLPELAGGGPVLAYAGLGEEVVLDAWIRGALARGRTVALPLVTGEDLLAVPVTDLDADVAPGWRGLREPRAGAEDRTADLEAVLVPGLGFDRRGGRLGQGGGHYDRLLARVPAGCAVVGVAFAVQLVPLVPTEPHDRGVDVVVTDAGVVRPDGLQRRPAAP